MMKSQPFPQLAAAEATITILNLDDPGEGLNDSTPVAPVGGNLGSTLVVAALIDVQPEDLGRVGRHRVWTF